jgi:hypothetical protein
MSRSSVEGITIILNNKAEKNIYIGQIRKNNN